VVKDTDFKFDKHVFRDSTDITPQKFFETGARPGTHDPLNFGGLTLALQVGGNLPPPRPSFLTTAPKLLGIFWNPSVTFPRNLMAREPQRIFAISLTVLQILVGNEGHPKIPNGEKAGFKRNSGYVRVPQVEKYNEYIHVFICSQASDASADFS